MPRTASLRLALAILSAAVAGCGGGDGERGQVDRYLAQANAIQRSAAPSVARANRAYATFSRGRLDAVHADLELTGAERSIRATRGRLSRLRSPSAAAGLHRRLLRVYALDAAFAADVTRLARYLPAARRALRPLGGIGARLRARLRRAKSPRVQAEALRRYARRTAAQEDALRGLDPPPLLLSTHRSQLQRLDDSVRLARALRAATLDRDAKRVARLVLRFRRVAAEASSTQVSRPAIGTYQRRYRSIADAVADVHREQARLQRRLDQ